MPAILLKLAFFSASIGLLYPNVVTTDILEVFPMDYIDPGSDGSTTTIKADIIDRQSKAIYRCDGRTQRSPTVVSVSCSTIRAQGLEIGPDATIKTSGGHREVNALSFWIVDSKTRSVVYCSNDGKGYICAKTRLVDPNKSGG